MYAKVTVMDKTYVILQVWQGNYEIMDATERNI